MKVGHNQYAQLVMDPNRPEDGYLLSAIVVRADDGRPGDGFLPHARSMGFDAPIPTLQRRVWDTFGDRGVRRPSGTGHAVATVDHLRAHRGDGTRSAVRIRGPAPATTDVPSR